MFHGPRELILPFFESQSFKCPDDKGAADFLQEVTTGGEQRVGCPPACSCLLPVPRLPCCLSSVLSPLPSHPPAPCSLNHVFGTLLQMYWAGKGEYKYVSDAELADAYRATETGQAFAEELKLSPEEEVQGHGELAVHT